MRKQLKIHLTTKNVDFIEKLLNQAKDNHLSFADFIKERLDTVPTVPTVPIDKLDTVPTVPTVPTDKIETVATLQQPNEDNTMSEPKMFLKLEVDDEIQLFIYKCESENKDPKQIIKKLVNYYLNKSKQPVKLSSKDKDVFELKEVQKDILNNEAADLRKEKHIIYDVSKDNDW